MHVQSISVSGLHRRGHRVQPAEAVQPVPGESGHCGPARGHRGHAVRPPQRSGHLELRGDLLQDLDLLRRHVQHGQHRQPLRHQSGQVRITTTRTTDVFFFWKNTF